MILCALSAAAVAEATASDYTHEQMGLSVTHSNAALPRGCTGRIKQYVSHGQTIIVKREEELPAD